MLTAPQKPNLLEVKDVNLCVNKLVIINGDTARVEIWGWEGVIGGTVKRHERRTVFHSRTQPAGFK